MKYGVMVSTHGEFADPDALATLAREAESAGWDGFFTWDHIATASSPRGRVAAAEPLIDTWVALTVIAMSTERIRFGPRVTPLRRGQGPRGSRKPIATRSSEG